MFTTNQKVVCIDDNFPPQVCCHYTALPEEGKVYVVRGVAPGIGYDMNEGELCIYLVGLQNPCSSKPPHRERGFKAERFRPLDEMQSEIMAEKDLVQKI